MKNKIRYIAFSNYDDLILRKYFRGADVMIDYKYLNSVYTEEEADRVIEKAYETLSNDYVYIVKRNGHSYYIKPSREALRRFFEVENDDIDETDDVWYENITIEGETLQLNEWYYELIRGQE